LSRYNLVLGADAPPWAQALQADLNNILLRIRADMRPKYIAKANLPTDGSERLAIVTDEAGGEVLAFFTTATEWRRVTDRAIVS
jgi:hypothetical protein